LGVSNVKVLHTKNRTIINHIDFEEGITMKPQILYEIKEGLARGRSGQYGSTADVTVDAELLNAKWTTGSKKKLLLRRS
jgi:hypothetical protein